MLFKKKRDPFDCTKRDLQWFKSPEGKQAYEEYIKYFDEMICAYKVKGIDEIISCNNQNEILGFCSRRWPCAYFYEFLNAYDHMWPSTATSSHMISLLLSDVSISADNGSMNIPYPDVFDKNKNPILYFANNCQYAFRDIETDTLVTIFLFYIHNGIFKNRDNSKESWLYDINLFFDSRNLYIGDAKAYEIVKKYAKHKEDIPNM